MKRSVIVLVTLLLTTQTALSSEWTYHGEHGPDYWADVSPDFSLCAEGVNQSPVDIRATIEAELPPIRMTGSAQITHGVNNGHTVQFDFAEGITTTMGNKAFDLKQVHFHTPSENLVNGKHFAMESHFVHVSSKGELAVVAVMYAAGQKNETLDHLLLAVEQSGGDSMIDAGARWQTLMPDDLDYYYFSGSLTTPPCSEGVHWIVLKKTRQVSTEQIAQFRKMVNGANARSVQAPNSRLILH